MNDTDKSPEQTDVCLVMPPVAYGLMPSYALGILKACLTRAHITCHVDYANMVFHHALGTNAFKTVYPGGMQGFIGEYIFNEAAGIENPYTVDDFIRFKIGSVKDPAKYLYLESVLRRTIRIANEETKKTADRILKKNPKIVGCTAIFEQRNAALAILREVKKRRPEVITMMGGHACFDYAGMAMLEQFPFLDYVFCGESDDIFADCCRGMIDGTLHELPYGLLRQGGPFPEKPPHRIIRDPDSVPMPDYSDYMRMLHSMYGFDQYRLSRYRANMPLFLETSRGCWWGEKHPCRFCGLNGQTSQYRKKSPDNVLAEIRETAAKYENKYIQFTDNILPVEWFRELFPRLISVNEGYHFTAEVKANLSRENVQMMKKAGFDCLQPGIESLSDHVLKLLDKGVSAIQNVAVLKYMKENGINVFWNLLHGAVGETANDFRDQAELIPLIEHLDPPQAMNSIVYTSNSVYHNEQDRFGLKLVPDPVYRYISPDSKAYIERIAFQFVNSGNEDKPENPFTVIERSNLRKACSKWITSRRNGAPCKRLDAYDDGKALIITDSRSISRQRNIRLEGIQRDICLAAGCPILWETLAATVAKVNAAFSETEIRAAVDLLRENRLLIYLSDKYLFPGIIITREKSMELSYKEFYWLMSTDSKISSRITETKNTADIAEKTADVGREMGYLFDAETIKRTDLVPEEE